MAPKKGGKPKSATSEVSDKPDSGTPKPSKSSVDNTKTTNGTSDVSFETHITRSINVKMKLKGRPHTPPEHNLVVIYDKFVKLETRWVEEAFLEIIDLNIDLLDPANHQTIVDKPLIFLCRTEGKAKDPDPLTNPDTKAGGTIDMLPLILGQDDIYVKVLLRTPTGEDLGLKVKVHISVMGPEMKPNDKVLLSLTMISAHCLPAAKEGTFYVAALGLDDLIDPIAVNFGLSLNSVEAEKVVWATASTGGKMMSTAYNAPNDDKFIPPDVDVKDTEACLSVYWYAIRRILVDVDELRQRLASPFYFEAAGVPRTGRIDVRGRFMGFIDAKVLLEATQTTVTTCAKLRYYAESFLPENVNPLLELPPASAKASARAPPDLVDMQGHTPYVVIKLDVMEALKPKAKMAALFDIIGFLPPPPEAKIPFDLLYTEPVPEDHSVDVRKIRKEGNALAVHKELSGLACRGAVPMNQGIKRTAANRLLTRVKTMLKQFAPGECSYVEWQDTVTAQHAACRRAVTASFRPHLPPERPPNKIAASRCRMAGDTRIANSHVESNLKLLNKHPRSLLSKALRCLEARNDRDAEKFVLQAISLQTRNRYLLWVYGALKFNKGPESFDVAIAAFQIAVKGDYSDGIAGAIGWAALHTLYHFSNNFHASFVGAKKMRKSYELKKEWKQFYKRWVETSGEEEFYWIPGVLCLDNPLIIAAAFFLCLRGYELTEKILKCFEAGCATRGSRLGLKTKVTPDIYYLRAASLLLRRQLDSALEVTEAGIKRFGPAAILSQMRATCLMVSRGWDDECDDALAEAERAGAEISPSVLLQAALSKIKTDPDGALQRAARAHKAAPCAHSALAIARCFSRKGENALAERWAAAAVKWEPLLADGWALLALLAMGDRDVNKARTMLRTARQAGPVCDEIERQLKKVMHIVKVEEMSDIMMKNLCLCDYLHPNDEQ